MKKFSRNKTNENGNAYITPIIGGLLIALTAIIFPSLTHAGLFSANDLPQCDDQMVLNKADEAMTAWLRGTGVDWKGSGYQKNIQPALDRLKEKQLDKTSELRIKNVVSQQLSAKLSETDPSKINIRFCDATVGGVWVQVMLIQNPVDDDDWGLAVQTNIRNFKLVPAPGLAALIFTN
tara:strand:- start:4593 stop:5126 length:534 start_codon:yes stop_codon:yes gene_type:complete